MVTRTCRGRNDWAADAFTFPSGTGVRPLNIFYIIGVIVVIVAILSFLGLT